MVTRLARIALRMTPSDSYFLHTVGRHPFLPLDGLASVLGWSTGRTRLRCGGVLGSFGCGGSLQAAMEDVRTDR